MELTTRLLLSSEIRAIHEEERLIEHVISDESVDLHGSIIRVAGWDLSRIKNGAAPVLFGHNARSALPIGQPAKVFRRTGPKALVARTRFAGLAQGNELAEVSWLMAKDGFMRSWSVGFYPGKREKREDLTPEEFDNLWDPYVYTEGHLLVEYSLVPVPSNGNAVTDAKARGINVDPLLDFLKQDKEFVELLSQRGVALPGLNDAIRLSTTETPVPDGSTGQLICGWIDPQRFRLPESACDVVDTKAIADPEGKQLQEIGRRLETVEAELREINQQLAVIAPEEEAEREEVSDEPESVWICTDCRQIQEELGAACCACGSANLKYEALDDLEVGVLEELQLFVVEQQLIDR